MDKIQAFSIVELTMEGFKCFAEAKTFRFGGMNAVTGHNGQGKTSIAEAIAYAITGVPFFGGEQSLDRLYGIGGKSMSVALTIDTGGGNTHKLIRCREKDSTSMTYDGIPIRQTELNAMFGEKDVFLSILNPLYFIEILGDRGKNLLERYLPAIPHETVLAGLSGDVRALLEGQKILSPGAYLEKLRGDVKDLESAIVYTEGQRDLLASRAMENAEALKQKTGELAAAGDKISALELKRAHGIDLSAMKEQLNDLYMRRDALSKDGLPAGADTSAIDAGILAAEQALEKRRAETNASPYAQHIAETRASVAQLRARYDQENAVLSGLKPGIRCPLCKQNVTEQNIEAVKKSFAGSLADIVAGGRELTAQLNELLALDE
ncbi:MAG: AAA family ATPase, partial [Oscillospiraceae bacterium]|nr:AAA family ATPase [Oscillospiraceae bacterium]